MGRIMQKYRLSSAAWSSCPVSTSSGAVVLYEVLEVGRADL